MAGESGGNGSEWSWSKGFGAAGSTMGAVGSWMGVWANYNAQMASAQSIRNQATMQLGQMFAYNTKAYTSDLEAEDALKQVGEYEKAGRVAAYQRTTQLGQDIGRIYSGSAGSGIDVSSATAKNIVKGTRKMAALDVDAINTRAQQAQWTAVRNASAARQDAIWSRANEKLSLINYNMQLNNAQIAEEQASSSRLFNIISAVGSTFGAIGGWVGAAGH